MTPFRFGLQLGAGPIDELVAEAVRAEAAGFDVVALPDHVGADLPSPMLVLSAVAQATSTIRLTTFVINNEMRNPVQLAWEAATLDRLSGGRFELGIGAGHTPHEFAATGIDYVSGNLRKRRMAEAVDIMRRLFDGETVTQEGEHYAVTDAAITPPKQDRLPILIGGNGDELLTHAATAADIIGLQGLGRRLPDGHRHRVKFNDEWLDHQVGFIRDAAGADMPELNALVQIVDVTDDREAALQAVAERLEDNPIEGLRTTPYLAIGTHDEIAANFLAARERWGISYLICRDLDGLAPVIDLLRPH